MGIGSDNVYQIETDARGKLKPDHLEKEILRAKEEGALPFMVSATAGTTVLGAFDPLEDIANLCEKYGLWMHVDAAWGGGALMSQKYRQLLKGIQRSVLFFIWHCQLYINIKKKTVLNLERSLT